MSSVIRIASRRSALAMTQTRWVIAQLQTVYPDITFEIVPVVTTGDRILNVSLAEIGGKGLFVTEIESLLLQGVVDFAVHSLKDVPVQVAQELELAVFPKREDPRDVLVSRNNRVLSKLPFGAVVGTSSVRRVAQLRRIRPDLQFAAVRGNVETRLGKVATGEVDAVILAAAGLRRMGLADKISEYLPVEVCLPAIGQGSLAIEVRSVDKNLINLLAPLNDEFTAMSALAERILLTSLNGSCQVPLAGYCVRQGDTWFMNGLVASLDGQSLLTAKASGQDPHSLGLQVAHSLKSQGALNLLTE
ncbi:hydroxymethylbilane synthase [Alicyclobacillaceae bacterium I2511]|nr:hydroxymethylbilane synthase [Alicyclobacillaceae bacterium I2511]